MPTQDRSPTLATTERSMAVVELARRTGGTTLAEVQAELGMAKSTAYKHLRTMERLGYLAKEGERYHVGLGFLNLGEHAWYRKRGYRVAEEFVDELAERTDEEVDFFAENAGRAITVQVSYDASNPFTDEALDASENHWRVGTFYAIHSMAGGKAILSGFDDDYVREIIDRQGLRASTEHTITDPEELFAELRDIRETGFAVSEEEYAPGLCAVARRVDEPSGSVLGSLAVNVPKYRFEGALPEVKRHLDRVAAAFESELAAGATE